MPKNRVFGRSEGGCSYGLTYPGEPALFSEEWRELAGWFLREAKKGGGRREERSGT